MKTLYVHIGTPKTASSVIQEFCRDNNEILKRNGYYYPEFFPDTPYTPPWREAVNGSFLKEYPLTQKLMHTVGDFFGKYDNIILSDEQLWRYIYEKRKTLWEELMGFGNQYGFRVKVIVYLRRQDALLESWWNQSVKGNKYRDAVTWEEYSTNINESLQLDYYNALEQISGSIGKGNVIVRRYGRKYFPNGQIQEDFCNIIGLEITDEYVLNQNIVNARLSGNTHEIKRVINTVPHLNLRYNAFFNQMLLACSSISGGFYPNQMFSQEEAAAFVERYNEGNRKIAEEYLKDGMDLFDLEYEDIPKWDKNNPYLIDDIIRFVGETDIQLLRKLEKLQNETDVKIEKLQNEINDLKGKLKTPIRSAVRMLSKKRS